MKCPKCGYNSFEFLEACKKCSHDLSSFKQVHGLKAIVIPGQARAALAATLLASTGLAEQAHEETEEARDMFSFDLPDDATISAAVDAAADPFNFVGETPDQASQFGEFSFDDEPEPPPSQTRVDQQDDAFSSLLESSSMGGDDPFATVTPPSAATPSPAETTNVGEFDLNSFSWDEPETTATPHGTTKEDDDFNSLFGDSEETKK